MAFLRTKSILQAKKILKEQVMPSANPKRARVETVSIDSACGRVLAENVCAKNPLPPFDRARMDGFAVISADTFGAWEDRPVELRIMGDLRAGRVSRKTVGRGQALRIATGAPMPRGANSVVMVEHCRTDGLRLFVMRPTSPGQNVQQAGHDVMPGETVLRAKTVLNFKHTGLLAGLGMTRVRVVRKPLVGIISTGDELVKPNARARLSGGKIFDANTQAIMDGVRACGGIPKYYGIVPDKKSITRTTLKAALSKCDIVITSGGTSAGRGDLVAGIINELGSPGVLVHGINIRPGKPTIIGLVGKTPIIGLPGFPTSALVIFEVFAAPIIRELAGASPTVNGSGAQIIRAKLRSTLTSERGRCEFVPVHIIGKYTCLSAFPVGKGSGAITALTRADGFIEVPENVERIAAESRVRVRLFSTITKERADYVFIGSHCIGMELLVDLLRKKHDITIRLIPAGSTAGLLAIKRGDADVAGCHIPPKMRSKTYNVEMIRELGLTSKVVLLHAYRREQGILIRKGNPKRIKKVADLARVRIINRNPGSGTRILFDRELKRAGIVGENIAGYDLEAKTHTAVATAVSRGIADAGIGIRTAAQLCDLDFVPIGWEDYDLAVSKTKSNKRLLDSLKSILQSSEFKKRLEDNYPGLSSDKMSGSVKRISVKQ